MFTSLTGHTLLLTNDSEYRHLFLLCSLLLGRGIQKVHLKSLVVRLHFPAQLLYLVVSHLLRLSNAASSQKRVLTCDLK